MIIMCAHMASYHLISFQVSLRQGPLTPLYCPSYCPSSLWTSRSESRLRPENVKEKLLLSMSLKLACDRQQMGWQTSSFIAVMFRALAYFLLGEHRGLFLGKLELMRHSSVSKLCDAWLPLIMSGNAPCNFNCREKAKISMMPHSATVFIQLPHEGEPNSKVQPWS